MTLIKQTRDSVSERSESDNIYMQQFCKDICSNNKLIYAITLNFAPWKKIYGKRWDHYSSDQQEEILRIEFERICDFSNILIYEYIFERTKREVTHLHGIMCGLTSRKAFVISKYFHDKFGYKNQKINRTCYMTPTEVDVDYFLKYMSKDQ